MNGINTIRLLGIKRIKAFILGMLILIPCILYLYNLAFTLMIPSNRILLVSVYFVFIILFLCGIFLLFKTSNKLIIACLYVGVCLMSLSIVLYYTFIYIIAKEQVKYFFISTIVYILAAIITELILFLKKFYNFKQLGRMQDSFWLCLLGFVLGKIAYNFIKKFYGNNVSDIIGIGSFLLLAVMLGFLGLFYINKFYIANKYELQISIIFEE